MPDKTQRNAYARECYHWYLDHGICPKCRRNNLQTGYKRCLECRIKDNESHRGKPMSDERKKYQAEYSRMLREKRKAAGICTRCGKRKTDGEHAHCAVCRAIKRSEQREYNRKQGMMPIELRGEGYCTRCYKPIESGKLCAECYEYLVQQAEYMRSKQDNSEHKWRKASSAAVDIIKRRQTNGEPPRIDFNAQGGKVTLEENKRRTETI